MLKRYLSFVALVSLTACSSGDSFFSNQAPELLRAQQTQTLLSPQAHYAQAFQHAQTWQPRPQLTGAYALNYNGRPFLSYSFTSLDKPSHTLKVKIGADGQISSKEAPVRGPETPLQTPWQTLAEQALDLARSHGFSATVDYGVGLNDFKGMGLPQAGPKWTVMSFGDPNAITFFVIDDHSQQVWECSQTTADSGCQQIQQAFQSQLTQWP